jgi:hypothetical protein
MPLVEPVMTAVFVIAALSLCGAAHCFVAAQQRQPTRKTPALTIVFLASRPQS